MKYLFSLLSFAFILTQAQDTNDWSDPKDRTDYPNLDIGHYQLLAGKGNCMKCVSLSRKSLYASENPDCRAVAFKGAPMGKTNIVERA